MGEKQLQAIDSKDQEIPLFPFIYNRMGRLDAVVDKAPHSRYKRAA